MHEIDAMTPAIEALQLLAADAESQIAAFPDFVVVADELALTLDSALLLLEQEAARQAIPEFLVSGAREMDRILGELSGQHHAAFWSEESLRNDVRWHRLRLQSRDLLERLGIRRITPVVDDVFIRMDGKE